MASQSLRRSMKQRWSRGLLRTLGVSIQFTGQRPDGKLLLVSNHVSWLDIYLINSLCPTAFVSKSEVRQWPIIGWLAQHNDTLFLQRGSRGHAHQMNQAMAQVLASQCPVCVFPEGTTTLGDTVLHFHGALLQPALSAGAQLVPLAIRYSHAKQPESPAAEAAYAGETSLGESLWAIAGCSNLKAHLAILPALEGDDRKILALEARAKIAAHLDIPLHERVSHTGEA